MRKKVIAANWKMNRLPNETIEYIQGLAPLVKNVKEDDIILFVPYTDLFYATMTAQDTNIRIGAQNMHWEEKGAYTGEISAEMLTAIGVKDVIIGHSERRVYFGEKDEDVNKKLKTALKYEMNPIVCIGENIEERTAGKTRDVIITQLNGALKDITKEEIQKVVIAYEPLWAISGYGGTTASKEDANDAVIMVREEIEKMYGKEIAENMIIQYGGSVKASNANELFSMSDIDGGLVGGASLKAPEEFAGIVNWQK